MQIGVDSSRAVDNKRVFVVDTDEITRAALQFMLHDENETHELSSIAAAIDKAREWPPHLVLLGIGIVRLQGVAAIGSIKSCMAGAKVLLVCGSAGDALVRDAIAHGADGTLLTPLKIETVRRKVDVALGRVVRVGIPIVPG